MTVERIAPVTVEDHHATTFARCAVSDSTTVHVNQFKNGKISTLW